MHVTYFYSGLAKATLFSRRSNKLSIRAMSFVDHCGCEHVCVFIHVSMSVCVYACKCEKREIVDVGVKKKRKKKTDWRVKMCIFGTVRACVYYACGLRDCMRETKIACVGSNEKTPLPLCWVNVRVKSMDGLCVYILLCV